MTTCGINRDGRILLMGWPVTLSNGGFKLARSPNLATHIVSSAAPPGGVIVGIDGGTLELTNWNNVIGTKFLTPGKSYAVTTTGRLTQSVSGQMIGTALSKTELQVSVDPHISREYDVLSYDNGAISVGPLTIGIGLPSVAEGVIGQYRLDLDSRLLYGPKTDYGWGTGTALYGDHTNRDIWVTLNGTPHPSPTQFEVPLNQLLSCWFHGSTDGANYDTLYVWNTFTRQWYQASTGGTGGGGSAQLSQIVLKDTATGNSVILFIQNGQLQIAVTDTDIGGDQIAFTDSATAKTVIMTVQNGQIQLAVQ